MAGVISRWVRGSKVLILVPFLFGFPVAMQAQVTGTISGYLTDPSGAAVAQAAVTATLVQQNITRAAETDTAGSTISLRYCPAFTP